MLAPIYVKNKVKLTTMKPKTTTHGSARKTLMILQSLSAKCTKKVLTITTRERTGSVYVNYDITSDAKDVFLTEIFGEEDYTDANDDESKAVIDVVNNIESIKVGADFSQDKTLASYSAYA